MINDPHKEEISARIVELATEEVKLIINGHKATQGDFFQPKRDELKLLRCLLFGYQSEFCKIKKRGL